MDRQMNKYSVEELVTGKLNGMTIADVFLLVTLWTQLRCTRALHCTLICIILCRRLLIVDNCSDKYALANALLLVQSFRDSGNVDKHVEMWNYYHYYQWIWCK